MQNFTCSNELCRLHHNAVNTEYIEETYQVNLNNNPLTDDIACPECVRMHRQGILKPVTVEDGADGSTRSRKVILAVAGVVIALAIASGAYLYWGGGASTVTTIIPPQPATSPPPIAAAVPQQAPADVNAPPKSDADAELKAQRDAAYAASIEEGIAASRKGDIREAITNFRAAIARDPNRVDAFVNLSVAHLKLKKYDEAEADIKQALEIANKDSRLHYQLAVIAAAKGDNKQAIAALDNALAMGFKDVNIVFEDYDLRNLRNTREFKALLKKYDIIAPSQK